MQCGFCTATHPALGDDAAAVDTLAVAQKEQAEARPVARGGVAERAAEEVLVRLVLDVEGVRT